MIGIGIYIHDKLNQFNETKLKTATVVFSVADIVAKTQKTIIPACGAGNYINLFGWSILFKAGNTPYVGDFASVFLNFNNFGFNDNQASIDASSAVDILVNSISIEVQNAISSGNSIENGSLLAQQKGNLSGGNGIIIVTASYSIEPITP